MNGKKVDYLSSLSIPLFQNTWDGLHGLQDRLQREEWCGAPNSLRCFFSGTRNEEKPNEHIEVTVHVNKTQQKHSFTNPVLKFYVL
jgi:hypothetical protein